MNLALFDKLNRKGLISNRSMENVIRESGQKQYSLYWELNVFLYLGILLLTSGLGMLVYSKLNQIGRLTVVLVIAALMAISYFICLRKKLPFSTGKVDSKSIFLDYLLVLSCLSFVIFVGYCQYEYHFLGHKWGIAGFISMLFLFFTAYFFDHLGILCMAITNLAAWAGIIVKPNVQVFENDFSSIRFIAIGIALGYLLLVAARFSRRRTFKEHFSFTYTNFGMNLIYISCLAGLFSYARYFFIWLPVVGITDLLMYKEAFRSRSFYFLLMLALYSYLAFSIFFLSLPFLDAIGFSGFTMICLYFIVSGVGMIYLLIYLNKKFKALL
jgi:predicted membrane protein DUF2157